MDCVRSKTSMTELQQELREERRAIMSAECETEEAVQAVFRRYREIYGIEDYSEKQQELI